MPTSPLCIVTVSNVAVTWIQLPAPAQLTITLYIYWDRERSGGAAQHSWTHHWYNGIMPQNLDIYTETRKLPHLAHPSAGDAWDAVPCPDTAVLQCCSNVVTQLSSCSPHAVTAEHPQLHILMVTLAPTGDWARCAARAWLMVILSGYRGPGLHMIHAAHRPLPIIRSGEGPSLAARGKMRNSPGGFSGIRVEEWNYNRGWRSSTENISYIPLIRYCLSYTSSSSSERK